MRWMIIFLLFAFAADSKDRRAFRFATALIVSSAAAVRFARSPTHWVFSVWRHPYYALSGYSVIGVASDTAYFTLQFQDAGECRMNLWNVLLLIGDNR
jgi:hypothetical protein